MVEINIRVRFNPDSIQGLTVGNNAYLRDVVKRVITSGLTQYVPPEDFEVSVDE